MDCAQAGYNAATLMPAYALQMAELRVAEPQQTAEMAANRLSDSVAAIRAYVERHLSKEGEMRWDQHTSVSYNDQHLRTAHGQRTNESYPYGAHEYLCDVRVFG